MKGDLVDRGGVMTEVERAEMQAACTAFDNLRPTIKLGFQRQWDPCYERIEPGRGRKRRVRPVDPAKVRNVHL